MKQTAEEAIAYFDNLPMQQLFTAQEVVNYLVELQGAASLPTNSMRWVRASERLPENGYCFGGDYEQFVVRFKFQMDITLGIGYIDKDKGKIFNAYTLEEFTNPDLEWLESAPTEPNGQ